MAELVHGRHVTFANAERTRQQGAEIPLSTDQELRRAEALDNVAWSEVARAVSLDKGRPFVEAMVQGRQVGALQASARTIFLSCRAREAGHSQQVDERISGNTDRRLGALVAIDRDFMDDGRIAVWPVLFGAIRWSERGPRRLAVYPDEPELMSRWVSAIRSAMPSDNWEEVRLAAKRVRLSPWDEDALRGSSVDASLALLENLAATVSALRVWQVILEGSPTSAQKVLDWGRQQAEIQGMPADLVALPTDDLVARLGAI